MRPIDADEALKKLRELYSMQYFAEWYVLFDSVYDILKNAPALDAVEVVKGKDCKHWHEEIGWCDLHSHFIDSDGDACHPWESSDWKMFDEDDFCSSGERGENGSGRTAD